MQYRSIIIFSYSEFFLMHYGPIVCKVCVRYFFSKSLLSEITSDIKHIENRNK